ncbi:phage tail spike protein [Shouchella miscanthi]|uniref:phage tail spike protein n=1 Tax=Shouchella miscanthi TaxID=2598861 RepID=UPI00119EB882|nr:phage tail protein [Shouchella miscanthi]
MIQYNNVNESQYNQLHTVFYNHSYSRMQRAIFSRLPGARPVVLSPEREQLAVLDNAYDILLEQEVNGIDTLSFVLPFSDQKNEHLQNEHLIQIVDELYIIRRITYSRGGSGVPETEVFAEALWYDLQFSDPLSVSEWEDKSVVVVLSDILQGTDWRLGVVSNFPTRNVSVESGLTNRLQALTQLPDVYGGELVYHSDTMTIDFIEPIGRISGAAIVYEKNIQSIEATYDTDELITRLYPYGRENLSIDSVNDQVPYLDIRDDPNYTFTTKLRAKVLKDDRFTNPFHLKEQAQAALENLSLPRTSYQIKASDLSILSGMEHEQFKLGDLVRVYDKELGIDRQTRILAWRYNLVEPWETEIVLESKAPTLSDLLTGVQDGTSFLRSEDTIDSSDMLELSVFNLLLNSRADDGFRYWSNSGWEVDPVNGFSGSASFKAETTSGVKRLSQTVYPANRDHYVLSFRSAVQNFAVNEDGRVGVEVIVRYEDGTEEEPTFISLT